MPHLNRNVHHEYSAPENVRRRDRRRLRMRVCSQFHGCFDSRSGDWKTRVESGLADKEHHRRYLADFSGVRLLKEPRCEIDGTAGWRQLLCLRHCPMYASAFEAKIQPRQIRCQKCGARKQKLLGGGDGVRSCQRASAGGDKHWIEYHRDIRIGA